VPGDEEGDMASSPTSNALQPLYRAALLRDGAGLTDGELLEAFVTRRDEAYFEALVRRHGPMVLGVCRRILRNPHDAEDAFQAAFLVLARRAAAVVPRDLVGNWLYGVAYRTALAARRTAARRRSRERQVDAMPEPSARAEETWQELWPLLDRELNRLPARYRAPVVLCHLEGRTRKEAARQLGLPVGTVSGRLTTALRLLAKRLRRQGLALSVGALTGALSPQAASACVPPALLAAAVRAAPLLAAGQTAPGVVAAEVTALAKGVVKSMLLTRLKVLSLVLLAVAALGGGAALVVSRTPAAGQAEARDTERPDTAAPESARTAVQAKTDRELLQGPWFPVAGVMAGTKKAADDPKVQHTHLFFDGDNVTVAGSGPVPYTLDSAKQPKEIDIMLGGRQGTIKAIYEFDGSRLNVSWLSWGGGGERPSDFDTGKSQGVLIVFERRNAP
jgi:RNA polymerase sigma factor (sigma-70 family)